MVQTRMLVVLALVTGAAWETAVAQPKVRYICGKDQRSRRSFNDGPWHYCFDGFYYSHKTVPPHVREYFAKIDRESEEERRQSALRDADAKATREMFGSVPASEGATRAAQRSTRPAPSGLVEASRKPEAQPISKQKLQSIQPGTTSRSVIESLGDPHGKVVNSTDPELIETWTYIVEGGLFGSIRLKAGTVAVVRLPE